MINQVRTSLPDNWLYFFIGIAAVINFTGLFIPITGPDGALYAVIAKTMVQHNDYINLLTHGKDWLDKPHFPFWVTALSFKFFGFTTWAYKLPGILFLMMGAAYTYLFAKALYNKEAALWSVLILLTTQHIILSNNDVRAEPYLTGLIIASVYHFYKVYTNNSFWHLIAGSLFAACAIMTKGTFAIIPVGGAIAGHMVITKQWKALFSWKWLLAIILTVIFIIPEVWCLYRQFDSHPDKLVFGQKGVSGILFFFWDSQFGRFFNTGPIRGSGDPFFFVHTLLWAFLPWAFLLVAAIYRFIKTGVKTAGDREWFCICGSLLTFVVFSLSQFQLPHYLNIVFPFFAIIAAQYLFNTTSLKTTGVIRIVQTVVIILMLLIISVLHYFFRPESFNPLTASLLVLILLMVISLPRFKNIIPWEKIALSTVLASFIINLYLNLAFYPSLMKYQAGSEAAVWINKHNPKNLPIAELNNEDEYAWAFEFYNDKPVSQIDPGGNGALPARPFILYTPVEVMGSFYKKGFQVQTLNSFQRYRITRLKPSFLNRRTRAEELTTTVVVVVK